MILGEGSVAVYPPFPGGEARPILAGSFQQRENIDERRLLGIRLAWGQTRVALFLNWRQASLTRAGHPLEQLWKVMVESQSDADWQGKVRDASRVVELAARYFLGWLAAGGIDLSQQYEVPPAGA